MKQVLESMKSNLRLVGSKLLVTEKPVLCTPLSWRHMGMWSPKSMCRTGFQRTLQGRGSMRQRDLTLGESTRSHETRDFEDPSLQQIYALTRLTNIVRWARLDRTFPKTTDSTMRERQWWSLSSRQGLEPMRLRLLSKISVRSKMGLARSRDLKRRASTMQFKVTSYPKTLLGQASTSSKTTSSKASTNSERSTLLRKEKSSKVARCRLAIVICSESRSSMPPQEPPLEKHLETTIPSSSGLRILKCTQEDCFKLIQP